MTAPGRHPCRPRGLSASCPQIRTPSGATKKRSGQGTHTMKRGRVGAIIAASLLFLATSIEGWAQENFPNRPVRIVIPYAPGSVADVFARIIAQNMAVQWNGSIVG